MRTTGPTKRSQQKRISLPARTLRYMRQTKGMSLKEAGALCGISGSAIAHMEQGRMDIPTDRVPLFVSAYGFTMESFQEFLDGRELPFNYYDECFSLLPFLGDDQVKALYRLLVDLAKIGTPEVKGSNNN